MSASLISSACCISRPSSPPILSSTSMIASRETGFAPARAFEDRRALELVEHLFRVEPRDRADAERHVGQHFDENAAEPHHHERPELRIAQAADHHFLTGRRHLLDQPAFDARRLDFRQRGHRADRSRTSSARFQIHFHAAGIALVQDVGRHDFDHDRELQRLQRLVDILGTLHHGRFRHRDPICCQQRFAGGFVERRALLRSCFGR